MDIFSKILPVFLFNFNLIEWEFDMGETQSPIHHPTLNVRLQASPDIQVGVTIVFFKVLPMGTQCFKFIIGKWLLSWKTLIWNCVWEELRRNCYHIYQIFFERGNWSWVNIRSNFRTPRPPMYIYKHNRICINIYELVVTFVVT